MNIPIKAITAIITNIGMLDSEELADLETDFSEISYALAPEAPASEEAAESCEVESSEADLALPAEDGLLPAAVLPPSLEPLDFCFEVPFA